MDSSLIFPPLFVFLLVIKCASNSIMDESVGLANQITATGEEEGGHKFHYLNVAPRPPIFDNSSSNNEEEEVDEDDGMNITTTTTIMATTSNGTAILFGPISGKKMAEGMTESGENEE